MAEFFKSFKFKAIITAIIVLILTLLYSYFIADTIAPSLGVESQMLTKIT